jgi:hypothetical protein
LYNPSFSCNILGTYFLQSAIGHNPRIRKPCLGHPSLTPRCAKELSINFKVWTAEWLSRAHNIHATPIKAAASTLRVVNVTAIGTRVLLCVITHQQQFAILQLIGNSAIISLTMRLIQTMSLYRKTLLIDVGVPVAANAGTAPASR